MMKVTSLALALSLLLAFALCVSANEELIKKSTDFHAAKALEEGVVTLPSGLQYKVVTKGEGKINPVAADTVTVHYAGTTIDGEEFDSSFKRNSPATFGLRQVIKGWTDGVPHMVVGDEFIFYIPYDQAYGPAGRPPRIPQYASLIFTIKLLAIKGKDEL
eukprot:TRINITY_DN5911_c0_g1_i1.p1 TRINITY_DN5911_c0_g1~~TRINITY_DN5911_c0_g1_i1.p1  ORF type:complete len:160 (+),score=62.95 TRINITY_DN5911_c0_g1_i1:37-516(+)